MSENSDPEVLKHDNTASEDLEQADILNMRIRPPKVQSKQTFYSARRYFMFENTASEGIEQADILCLRIRSQKEQSKQIFYL